MTGTIGEERSTMVKVKIHDEEILVYFNGVRQRTYDVEDEQVVVSLLNALRLFSGLEVVIEDCRDSE